MEAVNGTQRQSGIRSIINCDRNDNRDSSYPFSKMAAVAVAVNSYPYTSEPPRYKVTSSALTGHSSSVHNLLLPTESRWSSQTSNDSGQSQSHNWQSLPSIHEALAPKPVYEASISVSIPTSREPLFPRTQTPTIPRTYPQPEKTNYATTTSKPTLISTTHSKRPPSQPIHSQPAKFPCSQHEPPIISFSEAHVQSPILAPTSRKSLTSHVEASRYEPDHQASERPSSDHSHQSKNHQMYDMTRRAPLSPSSDSNLSMVKQRSLPSREVQDPLEIWGSTRNGGGGSAGGSGGEEDKPDPAVKFRGGLKRNLDVWDFENNLAEINISSIALQEWSAHYNAIAQDKQHSMSVISDRMPSIDSINDIRRHQQKIYNCLEHLTRIINEAQQQNERATAEQRTQEQNNRSIDYDDDVTVIYGDDTKNHNVVSEAKKRRGRAAPPGRCHSCNRAETPEWRRGPDGARTLCNACGLHYAKLTRKNTINNPFQASNNSSLRPKSLHLTPRPL